MFLDRYPALKKALANQYQLILVGGAAAFSLVLANPLPLLLLLGAELVTMPILLDRLRRRMEIERKHSAREVKVISQEQQYADLPPASRTRFGRVRQLCQQIQVNYRGLSAESQGVLAEQTAKFDAILVTCLRRLWLLRKHDDLAAGFDEEAVRADVEKLRESLADRDVAPRIRDAWSQNLQIKEKLLETVEGNQGNRAALLAELDSIEALLQLLLQKSVAATDAETFSAELDDVLNQAEADAASVAEMEALVGSLPQLAGDDARLSDALRKLPHDAASPPRLPPPRTPAGRQRRS